MNCNECQNHLSAWLDEQLESVDHAKVEEHLVECTDCRAAADGLQDLHANLSRAMKPQRAAAARAADQVIAVLPRIASPAQSPRQPLAFSWTSLALGMALGFLLAALVLRPWTGQSAGPAIPNVAQTSPEVEVQTTETRTLAKPVAQLIVATAGEGIEYHNPATNDWQPVSQLPNFGCPAEGSIRTSDNARCELATSDGSIVRMNSGTEIVFHSPGKVELKRGEIWCRSLPQTSLEVLPSLVAAAIERAPSGKTVSPLSCTAIDASCVMSVAATGDKAVVTAATGNISVKARDASLELRPSETATITNESIDRDQAADRLLAASWMQPLLVRKGHADGELSQRVDELLAQIGESKLSNLYESEIRSLGEYGVLPLLRYVASPRSAANSARRIAAMRIVSDLAPPWAIGELIGLLRHSDAEVRMLSAAALKRITQHTQGIDLEAWRGDAAQWEQAAAAWDNWWNRNRDRYATRLGSDALQASTAL